MPAAVYDITHREREKGRKETERVGGRERGREKKQVGEESFKKRVKVTHERENKWSVQSSGQRAVTPA